MFKTIGIIGGGMVGGAVARYFKEHKNLPVFVYDKYKDLDLFEKAAASDIIFIAVPTPHNGRLDTSALDEAMERLHAHSNGTPKVVVIKSTVLPGTTHSYQEKYPYFKILMNPEFLRDKTAFEDFISPNKQIVGITEKSQDVGEAVLRLLPQAPHARVVDARVAELIKYATNAFLATKVIFSEQIYDLCQALGVDYELVREGFAADPRIGPSHTFVGHDGYRGYGGKCLPKDVNSFIDLGDQLGSEQKLLKAVRDINEDLVKGNI